MVYPLLEVLQKKNKKVLVLEKNKKFGEETSSRNSGVIHAGIYYPKNSLKAKLCVKGNSEIYSYAKERGIGHNKCGKLIIANNLSEEKNSFKNKKKCKRKWYFIKVYK